jgi:hypothetical protein
VPKINETPPGVTAGLGNKSLLGDFDGFENAPKSARIQAKKSANAQTITWLFEDCGGAIECLTKALVRADAAARQKDLAGAIWSMRAHLDEIALALDGIERLAAPQPDAPRFWIRIAGKEFYQSRSFYLSEASGNELFRRAGRLETRDDNRRAGL